VRQLTIGVTSGTTYYFQIGGLFNERGRLTFNLDVAPPLEPDIAFQPDDPSTADAVQFFDQTFDPVFAGVMSEAWDFGDGTNGASCCPVHRYAQDGDYTVTMVVTTVDGRSATASTLVHVRTHDVAIIGFSTPSSARSGQTRAITVQVQDTRYPENVEVQLLRSRGFGSNTFAVVSTLTEAVPVRAKGRANPFVFSYTFTDDDAAVGKVTFEAIATIVGTRDANLADNTVIAPITVVSAGSSGHR
jgi:PKD repeat protein